MPIRGGAGRDRGQRAGHHRGDSGIVRFARNLDWHDVLFADMLATRSRYIAAALVLGNDADYGALAEHVRVWAGGVEDLVYVAGEVGVGAGLIEGW